MTSVALRVLGRVGFFTQGRRIQSLSKVQIQRASPLHVPPNQAPGLCWFQIDYGRSISNRFPNQWSAVSNYRTFCSRPGLVGRTSPQDWPEHEFLRVAEACLETISEQVSELGFGTKSAPTDFDIELSQGVLTIALGVAGTYVLNTQTPNRQIWMSSPASGPWRYEWKGEEVRWVSTRDGHPLTGRLSEELSVVFKEPVAITFENIMTDSH